MNSLAAAPALEALTTSEPKTAAASASDVANLAYQLWQDRGCPMGSPDDDWYRAEELLIAGTRETDQ
jgi:hypothetical protein